MIDVARALLAGAIELLAGVEGADDAPEPEARLLPSGDPLPVAIRDVEPCELGVLEAAAAICQGKISPLELVDACLTRIHETDHVIGAFVRLAEDAARAQAGVADGAWPSGPLYGIPFGVKDLIDTNGLATERGSAVYAGRMAPWDATVVARIRAAGGILVGKTATHEIAAGVSTPHSRNPWNPARMTSGSSGGSAAALAARQVPAALGTDTGGSLRLPSAFCGTTAIRPTHGLVPRDGVMALAPSFDTVGPMARSAADCWLLLQVLLGEQEPLRRIDTGVVRLGVVEHPDIADALKRMRALGVQIEPVELPSLEITGAVASVLQFAEGAAQFRDHQGGFAADIETFLEVGRAVPVTDFLHAQRVRAAIKREYATLFERVDAILMPTVPVPELPHGAEHIDGLPLVAVLMAFTVPAGVAGLPAIAFPCGFSASGMPLGAQLVGPPRTEQRLASLAAAYQDITDWHLRTPPAF
ncbi:glutamyl-tRNA(Gln) amidotransferase subunit A [Lentzea sp. NBRC 105346]|uniref:amidase n=1 Tax=Lentzea sp. NBRC 105346 TaxID=3032205 RepID=UPI002554549B|nr:amidase [Lentzea sp. NBRC 105346]GLZ34039.1 glutamyl-tRNA(Gln) amidotransferase subunit A [Lentzea sp. NBRC 105346]